MTTTTPETRPNPDPTVLTRDEITASEAGIQREFALRQATRERESKALHDEYTSGRVADRELFEAKLETLREKFNSQDRILALMEEQRKERKEDDRRALEAALAAAEKARVATTEAGDKAITKTELSTAEQLKQQGLTAAQASAGLVALINTLTTRVERIENVKTGSTEGTDAAAAAAAIQAASAAAALTVSSAQRSQLYMIVSVLIAVGGIIAGTRG